MLEANFVEDRKGLRTLAKQCAARCIVVVVMSQYLWVSGCSHGIQESSVADIAEFQSIGPANPTVDTNRLVRAKIARRPHRVLPGEVLQLTMPAILQVVTSQERDLRYDVLPFIARVSDAGTIALPAVGDILVAGHSLAEIEASVSEAYYPAYATKKPSVYVEVLKPRLFRVSIAGGVNSPGVYDLQADQMSLVTLIMEAGGIVDEGAGFIRINHSDLLTSNEADEDNLPVKEENDRNKTLLLPVTGLNVPFADVVLHEGDHIVVDKFVLPRFTVLGLVNNEGLFPYPPGIRYSVIEAIALAGGLDSIAEPQWAVVYRLKGDGTIASQAIKVVNMNEGKPQLSAMKLMVKPGDIIALEHTPRTRSTQFLKSIFRINMGMYIPIIK